VGIRWLRQTSAEQLGDSSDCAKSGNITYIGSWLLFWTLQGHRLALLVVDCYLRVGWVDCQLPMHWVDWVDCQLLEGWVDWQVWGWVDCRWVDWQVSGWWVMGRLLGHG
jgi:hypothetical protein